MSMVLWDMFTGSASYREIFLRTLQPVFWTRLLWNVAVSLVNRNYADTATADTPTPRKEDAVELGALGKVYEDGEIIIHQGAVGDSMFVIQEGQVEIVQEQDGKPVRLAVREKGEFFGEMSIFEHEDRSATVRALGRARIITVDEKTLLRRIHEDPSLAYQMVRTMSQRIRTLSTEVAWLRV